jgi:hypothetical protein
VGYNWSLVDRTATDHKPSHIPDFIFPFGCGVYLAGNRGRPHRIGGDMRPFGSRPGQ